MVKRKGTRVPRQSSTGGRAKGKVGEPQSPARREASAPDPVPDRYADAVFFDPEKYRAEKEQRQQQEDDAYDAAFARAAGLEQPPQFPAPPVVNGFCDECGEPVEAGVKLRCKWWCSRWDTEEGKEQCPF